MSTLQDDKRDWDRAVFRAIWETMPDRFKKDLPLPPDEEEPNAYPQRHLQARPR